MKKRKTLGILGGMGPMASQLFYQKLIETTVANCDQDHLDILLYSHASLPDRTDTIVQGAVARSHMSTLLEQDLLMLQQMGAEMLAVPCNTSHVFIPEIQEHLTIPIINMVEETVKAVAKRKVKKACILATEGTLQQRLYQNLLESENINYFELPCFLQNSINALIYEQIKAGELGNQAVFSKVENYLLEQEVDCIILACTELSVFKSNYNLPNSLYLDALDVLTYQCILRCGRTPKENIS